MIDSRELMVHNYVIYEGGIYFIQDISIYEGKYCSNLFDGVFSSFAKHHRILLEDLEPILISEPWLVTLGFNKWNVKNDKAITYSNGKLILHKRKRGWVINKNRKEPKYIHELQNISSCYYNKKLVNMYEIKFETRYIFSYYEGDEVPDFGGDYSEVELLLNGKVVAQYGDYYHDKSDTAVEAFIDGYCLAMGVEVPEVIITDVARLEE